MFTTKYMKTQPKASKGVKKYKEGGAVENQIDEEAKAARDDTDRSDRKDQLDYSIGNAARRALAPGAMGQASGKIEASAADGRQEMREYSRKNKN